MKKTYINPKLEVVELNMNQQLLAGSNLGMGTGNKGVEEADAPGMDIDTNMFGF